jgi:HlyD family secretion protein
VIQVRNSPITVQNVVTYDTVIGVNNADLKLKPGMTANVSIIVAERENALKIPNAALRFRPPETVQTRAGSQTSSPARASTQSARAGGTGGWKGGRSRAERSHSRTIYVLDAGGKPRPVEIKVGISDGIYTEVTDGLKEGDKVITGTTAPQAGGQRSGSSPFGGMRRF